MTKTLDSPHSSDHRVIDYAVMNQLLFEGKHKEVRLHNVKGAKADDKDKEKEKEKDKAKEKEKEKK